MGQGVRGSLKNGTEEPDCRGGIGNLLRAQGAELRNPCYSV